MKNEFLLSVLTTPPVTSNPVFLLILKTLKRISFGNKNTSDEDHDQNKGIWVSVFLQKLKGAISINPSVRLSVCLHINDAEPGPPAG